MSRILLASSEKSTSAILTKLLKTEGYKVVVVSEEAKAIEQLKAEEFNLLVTTVGRGPDADAFINVIRASRASRPAMPVIAIYESDGGKTAARLADLQLFAAMEKPLKVDKLVSSVQKAVDQQDASLAENVNLNLELETCYQFENIVAESPAMKSVCDMISRVAATDVTMLISGEKGTGKGLIAHAIHSNSRRKAKPISVVNCSGPNAESFLFALGGIEKANGGTLFLQGIDEIPFAVQKPLLQCLQDRRINKPGTSLSVPLDVRIIASATGNLQPLVAAGKFLPELFKLIKVIFIQLAPLRERKQDIMPTMLQILRRKVGEGKALPVLEPELAEIFQKYEWPGNVSEVESVLDYALKSAAGGRITKACLPEAVTGI